MSKLNNPLHIMPPPPSLRISNLHSQLKPLNQLMTHNALYTLPAPSTRAQLSQLTSRLTTTMNISKRKSRTPRTPPKTRKVRSTLSKKRAISALKRRITKRHIRNLRHGIRLKSLNSICADSGVCIAFGNENAKIKTFFDNFSFKYAITPIRRLNTDKPSANGFINEITFNRDGYISHAILKSSLTKSTDNLMYECRVGQYINTQMEYFPCFIETYGLYIHEDLANKSAMQSFTGSKLLLNKITQAYIDTPWNEGDIDWTIACKKSESFAILIQHLKDCKGFDSIANWPHNEIDQELPGLLFQVYYPLAALRNTFTHFDLHWQNAQLFEPVKGKYIQYHYHTNDMLAGHAPAIISFKSKYIVKIIDYGRCFFDDGIENTKILYDVVCADPECAPNCGKSSGLFKQPTVRNVCNMSQDLRLMHVLNSFPYKGIAGRTISRTKFNGPYYTSARTAITWANKGDRVYNVADALISLMTYVHENQAINDVYNNPADCLGVLTVKYGEKMTFVKTEKP